jgi:hypothetical protein
VIRLRNLRFDLFFGLTIVEILIIGYLLYIVASVVFLAPSNNIVTALIALIAALISFMNLGFTITKIFQTQERYEEFINYNYRSLEHEVSEIDKPVLKALIMMKSKHPNIDQRRIDNKTLFERDRLFERLYE